MLEIRATQFVAAEDVVAAGLRALHPSITPNEAIDAAHHLLRCALAAAEQVRGR